MKAFLAASVVIITLIVNLISIAAMRYLSVTQSQYVGHTTEIVVDLIVGVFTITAAAIIIAEVFPPNNTTPKRVY